MDQNDCRMQKRKNDGSYTELMIPKGTGKEKEKPIKACTLLCTLALLWQV